MLSESQTPRWPPDKTEPPKVAPEDNRPPALGHGRQVRCHQCDGWDVHNMSLLHTCTEQQCDRRWAEEWLLCLAVVATLSRTRYPQLLYSMPHMASSGAAHTSFPLHMWPQDVQLVSGVMVITRTFLQFMERSFHHS